MTAERLRAGPRPGPAAPTPTTARPSATHPVTPPSPDVADRHGRRRPGGRTRHPDEVHDCPRSSTRCAAGRCWPTSSTPGRAPPDGAPPTRPIVVYSPAVEAILTAVADRADVRAPGRPRGAPVTPSSGARPRVPADATEILVLSGDVPLVTGADLDAVLEARRHDDAAIALASVFAADPARLGRVVRSEFGTVERIVEAKDADGRRAGRQRDQRRASTPSTPSGCAGGSRALDAVARDRRAVPDRSRRARPRGRPHRQRGRLRGRRPVRRHQRPLAARRRRVEPARPAQRGAHAQRRDDARPVDGLPRLDGRARAGRDPRAERHPARRDVDRGGQRHRRRQPARRRDGRRSARVWASVVESSTIEDERHGRAVQPPPAGQRRRPRRRGRQLRRAQEHEPRRAGRSSTT